LKKYIIRRLLLCIVTVLLVSVIIFAVTRIGTDPALMMASQGADEDELNAIRNRFGLNQSLPLQYFTFLKGAVKGDLGESLYYGMPVVELVVKRVPATVMLIAAATFISLAIGVLGGVLAARKTGSWIDDVIRWFSLAGLCMPNFWIAMIMILIFSVKLEVLPTGGYGTFWHLLMPASSLGWYFSAGYTRLTYSALLETMNTEFIKLTRVKGLPEYLIVGKHALKNALIPVTTMAGMNVVIMISSAVAVERVFAWPGLGMLMYQSAVSRDFNTVQGVVLLISVLMVLVNLLVDVLYAYLDPRIRYDA
jgi:ABC-type dipeptide/oligopeptide/nickel transport system permease component